MKYALTRPVIGLLALIGLFTPPVLHAQMLGNDLGGNIGDFSLGNSNQAGEPQTLDKIVAVVNDDVILASELDAAVSELMQQRGGSGNPAAADDQLRSQVLDQLILRQLQIQRADKDQIQVSAEEMQQGVARIAQRNNMDLQQFTQAVSASGMSMDALRNRVRQEIEISKVRQKEVMGRVTVSDADVDRYLANQKLRFSRDHAYRLREIHIPLPEDADSTRVGLARERLAQARRAILAGETSFASAAQKIASDDTSAGDGVVPGNDGQESNWIPGNTLPDAFDAELVSLSPGQLSDVFRGDDGMYLIKLEDERGEASTSQESEKVMVTEANMRHIVLTPNEIRDAQRTRELARTLRQRIAAGDDFADLAREYSDDSATANQGGLVGWIPLNRLAPNTRRQISSLSAGETSRVFQSASGYEIVQVEAKRERDATNDAKRDKVRQQLGRKQAAEEGNLWLDRMRDEAYIDVRMPGYQRSPDSGA